MENFIPTPKVYLCIIYTFLTSTLEEHIPDNLPNDLDHEVPMNHLDFSVEYCTSLGNPTMLAGKLSELELTAKPGIRSLLPHLFGRIAKKAPRRVLDTKDALAMVTLSQN